MNNSSVSSSPARSSGSISGGNALTADNLHFPTVLISDQYRKDETFLVLKSDLMATLNKEAKSMDEDNWMFDGPRSSFCLYSKPGGRLTTIQIPESMITLPYQNDSEFIKC